ncbi:hypothetical protein CQ10_34275 [Bradyrhizobium valentinum]|nr:hypothetical protein CQ10_34275 [Bradyrhizobium valentinum]
MVKMPKRLLRMIFAELFEYPFGFRSPVLWNAPEQNFIIRASSRCILSVCHRSAPLSPLSKYAPLRLVYGSPQ